MEGRLGRDGDGRLEIDCNGEGALFVEADAADTTLDDYGDFAPTMELRRLIPAVEYTNDDDVSLLPLLLVQVTYFKCGGVCLGVRTDHYVADGMSYAHLMNSWSQLCRGTQISSMPSIDRTLLRARDPPTPSFRHVSSTCLHHPCSSLLLIPITSRRRRHHPPPPSKSSSSPARLRAAAPRVSTYAVVAAHVWRCVSLARGLPPEQPTMLLTAVDGRSRLLLPDLPDSFLNFFVFNAALVAEAGTVVNGGPAVAAHVIQAALDRMDSDYCRSALDYLDQQPDLAALARGRSVTFGCNLLLTSWVRIPIHDADFGWGRPVFMGPGGLAREGQAFVLPSANGDGSLSVAICLRAEHMDKFRELMYDAIRERTTRCSKL